jgi:hypothetical protein
MPRKFSVKQCTFAGHYLQAGIRDRVNKLKQSDEEFRNSFSMLDMTNATAVPPGALVPPPSSMASF